MAATQGSAGYRCLLPGVSQEVPPRSEGAIAQLRRTDVTDDVVVVGGGDEKVPVHLCSLITITAADSGI